MLERFRHASIAEAIERRRELSIGDPTTDKYKWQRFRDLNGAFRRSRKIMDLD